MAMGERFIGRVIDVNDPEQAGRLKIRIYGIHDDETKIPDDMLPWCRCIFPVTNPVHQGVAGATTGLVPNSTVVGYFADEHYQIPLIDGTLGSAADSENKIESDFPKHDRGEDLNPVIGDNLLNIGTAELKFLTEKTIGPIEFLGQDIGSMLSNIGEADIFSAVSQITSALDSFKDLKNMVTNSPLEQVNSLIQGYASDLGALVSSELDEIVTTQLGNVVNPVSTTDTAASTTNPTGIFGTTNHLTAPLGDVLSKVGINSVEDAINRMNGHRFVMKNVMGGMNSALDNLRIKFGK